MYSSKEAVHAGAGETGRIMGLFTQHKMIESSGRAEANMPAYSRRLWDDRGSFMPAPTIRTLVDVAMTVAVSCFTGGAGGIIMNALISTAFNMIDDAVFTLMDMANGMDPLDAVEGFAKKAATTFASSAISGAFNGVVPQGGGAPTGGLLQTMKLTDNVIGSTMLKGTEIMASNVASSAINSINLRGLVSGGDAFDEDAFGQGAFGRDAMAGVAAGMAGNAVTVGMRTNVGSMDYKDFNVSTGDIDFNQINKLGGLAGSAASALVQYGMTGETTVNILNAHTLAGLFGVDLKNKDGDAVTTGLFGLTFGNDGVHGSITTSGYAMDVADIMVGLQAFDDISAKNDLQRDVNNAARERERIKNITDRVIAIGEVSYEGNTDQAASLLAQLQGVRSLQSKDNLHSMFQNKAENGYSESRLDENLDLAFKQHDISVNEFMNSAEFDTVGSFKHAMTFYNRSFGASKAGSAAIKQLGYNVTLEDMFSTGKAYAGKITDPDNQSRMIEQKKDLLNKYYAKDIAVADNFMGRSDVFDAQTHMNNRIVNNKMNLVGQDMAAVAGAERDRLAFMKNLTTLDGLQAQHKKDTPESPKLLAAIETFYATQEQMFNTGKGLHQYAKEFGLKFNFGTGYNEAANSAHNADKSAYSPVYNSGRVTTLHGHNAVDPKVAAATGREFGQDRGHPAFDVSGGLFVALEKGTLGMNWVDKEGIQIVLTNGSYQHTLGHNFSATADRLMELCVTNGTRDVEAGTVIGQYQEFESNASTGAHVHWSVAEAILGKNGKIEGYRNIDNSVWADRNGLTDVFQPTADATNYSGLENKLSPEAGRQLYKKNNPEIYYNWLGKVNFGVPVIDSEEEYTYWEENLPHRKKASKQ